METAVAFTDLNTPEAQQACPVLGHDGRVMQLKMSKPVDIGSAVKVETGDTISLGEVSFCRRDGEGYVVWVEIIHALHNVAELSRLARALLG